MFSRAPIQAAVAAVLEPFGRRFDEPLAASTLGASLCLWAERVVAWNERIDLTAARSVEELVDLLVADAAAIAPLLARSGAASCIDVGSGAGAPGLALALLLPGLPLTLAEPKAKRVAFLRNVLGALGRSDVRVERKRSEELPGPAWDAAVSRATFEPTRWLEEGTRLARNDVWVLLAQQEAPSLAGVRVAQEVRYRWPLTAVERRAVAYARVASLPE